MTNNTNKKYEKPPLIVDEQIKLLVERGLVVDNLDKVKYYLTNVSYYHWSIYFKHFQKDDKFFDGINFDDILRIYIFDNKLRLLLLEVLERVEKAFKCRIAYELSLVTKKSHCYLDGCMFSDQDQYQKILSFISDEVKDSQEVSIKHYLKKYEEPSLPPIWSIVEILSFGQCGKIFKALDIRYRNLIGRSFGIDEKYIASWMHSLSILRNSCAHYSRTWNKEYNFRPMTKIKKYEKFFNQDSSRIFNYLVALQIILSKINPTSSWVEKLKVIIADNKIDTKHMGFPEDWERRFNDIMAE